MSNMQDAEANLCLSCSLAIWQRTSNKRLHPSGDGRCGWRLSPIVLPAAFYWVGGGGNYPSGGHINRQNPTPICAQHKVPT